MRSQPIQLTRIKAQSDECGCWYVKKNIKELGFWGAYQWWEGCKDYYKRHNPQNFEEETWNWGLDAGKNVGSMYDESIWLNS